MSSTTAAAVDLNATTGNGNNKGTNVQVVVRCRPLNGEERKSNQPSVAMCEPETKSVKIAYGPMGKKIQKSFNFDKVFGVYSRQEEVFDSVVRPIVDETLAGFNCTIFAYGQTGTGKTHTMEGDIHSKEDAGIVPRAVNAILEQLEASGAEFTIRVSFLELYNEELQDLLNTSGDKKLKLCEDVKKGVVCQNLEEIAVLTATDIFEILQRGIQQRQTAATLCNKNSSRSHSIFTMKIMIKEYNIEGEEVIRNGQLNLVDLAGSECIGRSGAKNDRAREAGSINQSLLTLGRVITALVDHHPHVPYRDSKLTRLLQESLGGKAKTCIIATFSPAQAAVEETLSTLDYAHRAKNIKNQPTVNQKLTKKVIMKEYFAEIETLRNQLFATREKNGVYLSPEDYYAMENKLATQEAQLTECEGALKQRQEEVKQLRDIHDSLQLAHESTKQELSETVSALQESNVAKTAAQEHATTAYRVWQSTEAVVDASKRQEKTLLAAGQSLKESVSQVTQQAKQLRQKVDVLEAAEAQRMQVTQRFTASMNQREEALQMYWQAAKQQTESMRQDVRSNVAQLNSVVLSLQEKLMKVTTESGQTIEAHQQVQKQSMDSALGSLHATMTQDATEWQNTFAQSAKDMQSWLMQLLAVLQENEAKLNQQCSSLSQMQTMVQEQTRQSQSAVSAFVSEHTEIAQNLEQSLESVFVQLNEQMEAMQTERQTARRRHARDFEAQTQAMSQKLTAMLQELSQSQASMVQMAEEHDVTERNQQKQLLETGRRIVLEEQMQAQLLPAVSGFASRMQEEISSQERTVVDQLQVNALISEKLVQTHNVSQENVGHKRSAMEAEMNVWGDLVQKKAKSQMEMVEQTQVMMGENLNILSKDVQDMQQLQESTADTYIQGKWVPEQTNLHQTLDAFAVTSSKNMIVQEEKTQQTTQQIGEFESSFMQSRVPSSGQTPRKIAPAISPVLQLSKPAHVIRSEVLNQPGFANADYSNLATNVFPNVLQQVTTASSSSVSDVEMEEVVAVEEEKATVPENMDVSEDVQEQPVVSVTASRKNSMDSAVEEDAKSNRSSTSSTSSSSSTTSSVRSTSSRAAANNKMPLKIDMDVAVLENAGADMENLPPNCNSTCSSAAATPSGSSAAATKSKLPMTRSTRSAKSNDLSSTGNVSMRSTRGGGSAFFGSDN